jgi:hypothetical protein
MGEVIQVDSRCFSEVLRSAVNGDPVAVEAILLKYMPLFNNRSVVGGEFSEDLRQYIMMRVIMELPKFDPNSVM